MNRLAGALATVAFVALAAPAGAVPFTFNLGAGGTATGSGVNKTIEYSSSAAPDAVKVKVSGWTNDRAQNPDRIEKAEVAQYGAANGVGVLATGDNGGNEHAVDNVDRTDFLVLRFNQAVNLDSAYFTPWNVNNIGGADSDASIYYGNNPNAYSAALPYENELSDDFFASFAGPVSLSDVDGLETIDTSNAYANTWIISASTTDGGGCLLYWCAGYDAFKVKSISGTTGVPPAVPEPATWAMMISGFGFVGASLRRRRTKTEVAAA